MKRTGERGPKRGEVGVEGRKQRGAKGERAWRRERDKGGEKRAT